MRLKFRLWNSIPNDPAKNKMFYDTETVMECLKQQINYDNETVPCHNHIGDGSVFMQYTGFKDRNWKEVYEGDIVEHYIFGKGKIVYDTFLYCLKCQWLDEGASNMGHCRFGVVIGNIYENHAL